MDVVGRNVVDVVVEGVLVVKLTGLIVVVVCCFVETSTVVDLLVEELELVVEPELVEVLTVDVPSKLITADSFLEVTSIGPSSDSSIFSYETFCPSSFSSSSCRPV